MRKDRPSRTALRVASSRAAHQILDEPKILDDPLAMRIIGVDAAQEILGNRQRHQSLAARYLRAFVVARSRVAEDTLAQAVARGVRQYVVLGAGLDTFACRNPYGDALQVFEVDHPATQTWKRSRLAGAGIATPGLAGVRADRLREPDAARAAARGRLPPRGSGVLLLARRVDVSHTGYGIQHTALRGLAALPAAASCSTTRRHWIP